MKHTINKKYFKNFYILLLSLIMLLVIYLIADQYIIVTTNYSIKESKINNKITIAMISDLHNMNFGNNQVVVDKIRHSNPDIIVALGDIIDERHSDITPALTIMNNLPDIANTYYIIGNHDQKCSQYDKFLNSIQARGVQLLDDEITDITINNNKVSILGLTQYSNGEFEDPEYTALIKNFCEKDAYKILLTHYPEYTNWFFDHDKYYEYNFDLMLCGHTHGGVVKLPFIGGIYAPNQGCFPKYVYGKYYVDSENKNPYNMVITSGLGQDPRFFRVNNFPEIAVVTVEFGLPG